MAFSWLINGGYYNYLLSGVILQVPMRSTGVSSNVLQVNWLGLNIAARKLDIVKYVETRGAHFENKLPSRELTAGT